MSYERGQLFQLPILLRYYIPYLYRLQDSCSVRLGQGDRSET